MQAAKPKKLPGPIAVRRKVRYALRRSHRNHLLLKAIDAVLHEVETLQQFILRGKQAKGWVEIQGGSTHGADFTVDDARKAIRRIVQLLAQELGIRYFVWFIHLSESDSGRLDFHIFFVMPDDNRTRSEAILWKAARKVTRLVAEEINEARLAAGQFTIGYVSVDGIVVYPLPTPVEKSGPTLSAPQTTEAAAEPPTPANPPSTARPSEAPQASPATDNPEPTSGPVAEPPPAVQAPRVSDPLPAAPEETAPSAPASDPQVSGNSDPDTTNTVDTAAPPPPPETTLAVDPNAAAQTTIRTGDDLTEIAAATKAAEEREKAQAKLKQQEEEAKAEAAKRARLKAFNDFLQTTLRLIAQAEAYRKKLNDRMIALRRVDPASRIDDPLLRTLLKEGQRFLDDPSTRDALATTLTTETDDSPDLKDLKARCRKARDQAQVVCSELTDTVTGVTAVLETWRPDIETKLRGPDRT